MTFMETMREGTSDQVFEKLFPIVGNVIGAYVIALLVVWFVGVIQINATEYPVNKVDFGAMLGVLLITGVVIVILFLAVLVAGYIAKDISSMITDFRG